MEGSEVLISCIHIR